MKKIFEIFKEPSGKISLMRVAFASLVFTMLVDWYVSIFSGGAYNPPITLVSILSVVAGLKVGQKKMEK